MEMSRLYTYGTKFDWKDIEVILRKENSQESIFLWATEKKNLSLNFYYVDK